MTATALPLPGSREALDDERAAPRDARGGPGPGEGIPNPLQSAALARPDHPALVAAGQTWTASDLLQAVLRQAGVLAAAGVVPGETVALCGPPSAEWIVAFHAIGWLGAAVAPLPPRATPDELARALAAARPDRVVLTHGLDARTRDLLRPACGPGPAGVAAARFLTELPLGPAPPERFWPPGEARVVLLTSGSTGAPRAVRLTTTQLVLSAFGSAIRLGHALDDRWLACLPLHHAGGLMILVRCALYGTTVVLHDRFDAARAARVLDAGEVTLASFVPAMLERVLDARGDRPVSPSVRAILLGGDAAPPALLERCRRLALPVAVTWGMTETASQVATRHPGDLDPAGGCGAVLPFARVVAQDGLLVAHGPLAGPAGEVRTSDRGAVVRGVVHVSGRADDTIKSGGEAVDLARVEAALRAHPDLLDVAVVAVPDARWGHRPGALVVPRPGRAAPTLDALRAWSRERLPEPALPAHLAACEAVPRTALGKLDRPAALARLRPHARAADAGARHAASPPLAPREAPVGPAPGDAAPRAAEEACGSSRAALEPRAVEGASAGAPPADATARRSEAAGAPSVGAPARAEVGDAGAALDALRRVSAREGEAPLAARIAALRAWLDDDLRALDRTFEGLPCASGRPDRRAGAEVEVEVDGREGASPGEAPATAVREAARHILRLAGKRLRPLALVLAARLGGRGLDPVVRDLAVAAELVHGATLLHDDVIDEGTERRGAKAARIVWGNSASVLAGDALFTEALRRVAASGDLGLLDELLAVIAVMVDAEALQLERRGRVDLRPETYWRVVRGKTAALFRWSLRAGGAAAGLPAAEQDALGRAGEALGLAFQLADDVLDVDGDPSVTGKDALADLRQGKVTWPLISAAARDAGIGPALERLAATGEGAAELVLRVRAAGGVEATRAEARARAADARAALAELPAGPARAALETIVEAAVERVR